MLCWRKKSGVRRRLSASHAIAFAPFSQNSVAERPVSGSGQAQLGQSTPPGWLTVARARVPRTTPAVETTWRSDAATALAPAAAVFGSVTFGGVGSSGQSASGTGGVTG